MKHVQTCGRWAPCTVLNIGLYVGLRPVFTLPHRGFPKSRRSFDSLILAADALQFSRDILPLLSTNCDACHGLDETKRMANLRFDIEADAKTEHDSGVPIVPGKPDESTLIQCITSTDLDVLMPPPDSHNDLKPAQLETLRRWVTEGGAWGRHWSFEPVERPQLSVPMGESSIDVSVCERG